MTRSGLTDPLSRPPLSPWQTERARGELLPMSIRRGRAALLNPAVPASERRGGWIVTGCVALLPAIYIIWSVI